jgi:lipopolysaccharide transport system permease protein
MFVFSHSRRPAAIVSLKALLEYREIVVALAWKNISLRYKQAYLGIAWAILRPLMLMGIFVLLRAFVGIDSGAVPYPVLAYAALLPWTLFQETASEGVNSIVSNAHLIRKIYFPREVFPLTATATKLIEFGINLMVLLLMMAWYGIFPSLHALWLPLIVLYTVVAALTIAFAGAALNVYYRDVGAALPALLSMLMYASPIIYPLHLVQEKLLVHQAAGKWSHALYTLYVSNPIAGIVDAFQRVMLKDLPPDMATLAPGFIFILIALPLSYAVFKRAEAHFADFV